VSTYALDERQITAFASEFYRNQADRSAIADLYGIRAESQLPVVELVRRGAALASRYAATWPRAPVR
jgi:hypothetical protein